MRSKQPKTISVLRNESSESFERDHSLMKHGLHVPTVPEVLMCPGIDPEELHIRDFDGSLGARLHGG